MVALLALSSAGLTGLDHGTVHTAWNPQATRALLVLGKRNRAGIR
eukprot:CAMPEP_0181532364 /NCGR_PEP_ID=MMETSP1110-20121109/72579_1 /TAXON_ID=174948 /ORGANISM="Symbiodinium sp., Strain CCMP421" /LENGTH=44 /DNA_ID= /DNA_START= /DNA_END= /DNA_ORIENTATION=